MNSQPELPADAARPAHEDAGIEPRLILKVVCIILATLIALTLAGLFVFEQYAREYTHRTSEAAPQVTQADLPPEPRLQTQPLADLQKVRANEDEHLTRYAWVDRTHGIAQIPIDRAMALWVSNYKPPPAHAATTNAAPASVTELQMRQQKAKEAGHAP
jgi:hypothetical protein